jgi:hypothetical protein
MVNATGHGIVVVGKLNPQYFLFGIVGCFRRNKENLSQPAPRKLSIFSNLLLIKISKIKILIGAKKVICQVGVCC